MNTTDIIVVISICAAAFLSVILKKLDAIAALAGIVIALCIYAAGGLPAIIMLATFFVAGTAATSHKKNLNIQSGNIFKITLAEDIREVTQEEKEWFVPALSIPSLQGHFIISGEIPLVCSQGLISLQKDKKEEICKILPEILIYHLSIDRHQLELPKTLLLPREGTFKNFNFPSEILLKN